MPSNHLALCCPLFLLPSIFPSISVFSNESTLCVRWSRYWSFSFSISPSNEYSGLISFMIDWFDLAVQGTLKSLLQHHSSIRNTLKLWANYSLGIHTLRQWTNYFWSLISCVLNLYSSKYATWRAKNSTDQANLYSLSLGVFSFKNRKCRGLALMAPW